ncbi:MAG: prephenate dehydrogenase/arogenate dehydrogenase family protein [Spirochaetales bacterium]|nr:prephenate dehydrogenase/arogenate dehydrogenase family protein [Spirochaetales bacterium]MCF7937102.1 prephenate dehydrogenase/arogenate dehydrogenase family protein [Spirochaetales bacterium]
MKTIGVYGLGRFGSFWAGALSRYFPVRAWSRSPDRETPEGVERCSEDTVLQSDTLFLCVSISAMESVLERISARLGRRTLVFDTCSVKVDPVEKMKALLPADTAIIGSHPMFGPDSAGGGLEGLPVVLSRVRGKEEWYQLWKSRFLEMGLRVLEKTPDEHDREAAYTQGITHFIGRMLGELELQPSSMATVGYNKLLDIIQQTCNDPLQLFADLQRYNPYTSSMHDRVAEAFRNTLELLERSIDEGRR